MVSILREGWVNPLSGKLVERKSQLLDLGHLCDQHAQ